MAWQASPIKAILFSKVHGKHFIVTKVLVGFLKKSFASSGITSIESGKFFSKKSSTILRSTSDSKEFAPSKGINKVQVKLPSRFGSAINIYSPLGQMWKEFLSSLCVPSAFAGIFNSLYPIFKNS